jgi:hypothetical protein
VAVVLVALVALAGCGEAPIRTVVITIPRGTASRLSLGQKVNVMPPVLRLHVGDRLRIINRDIEDQTVGPWLVTAGNTFEARFGTPGRYEGLCPLSDQKRYEIVVT